jgi:predicted Zn finger-like uncharacterized protein
MKVTCPKCGAAYDVHADRVPAGGIDMKCSRCLHTFKVDPHAAAAPDTGGPVNLPGVTFLGQNKAPAATDAPTAERFYIQRPSGKVFGPFEKRLIIQMLKARKLTGDEGVSRDKAFWVPLTAIPEFGELLGVSGGGQTMTAGRAAPAPVPTSATSPPPVRSAPAPTSANAPPPVRGGSAPLPIPKGLGAELPPPLDLSSSGELPVPVGTGAELPAPVGMFDAELPAPVGLSEAELPGLVGGGAELPGLVGGGAELPAPVGAASAELPAPVGFGAELPALAGHGAELPGLTGGAELPGLVGGLPELPIPADPSVALGGRAELPIPRGGFPGGEGGGTELPVSRDGGPFGGAGSLVRDKSELGGDPFASVDLPVAKGFDAGDDLFAPAPGETRAAGAFNEFGETGKVSQFGVADMSAFGGDGDGSDDPFGGLPPIGSGADDFNLDPPSAAADSAGPPSAPPVEELAAQPIRQAEAPAQPEAQDQAETPAVPDLPKAPVPKKKKKAAGKKAGGKLLLIATALVGVALVIVVGLIAMETDLFSGTPDAPVAPQPTEVVKPQPSQARFDALRADTYASYRRAIEATVKELSSRPDDVGLKSQVVASLVLYLAHYPEDEQYMKEVARYAGDLEGAEGPSGQVGRGAFAALTGNAAKAHAELSPLTKAGEFAYIANLLLGLQSTLALSANPELPPVPGLSSKKEEAPVPAAADTDAGADAGGNADAGDKQAPEQDGASPDKAADGVPAEMDLVAEVMAEEKSTPAKAWRKYAADHLRAARKIEPKAPAPSFWLAVVEGDQLAPGKAKKHLNRLLKDNPQHVPGLLALSHLSYLGGDLDAARAHATPVTKELAAAASKKERSQAHLLIGLIAQARRQSTAAQTSLVEALSVDPQNTRALKALGEEFKRARKYEEALNYFTTNAGLSQKDPEVMIGIVTSLLGLERRDEAMQRLEQGITAFPKDPRFAFHLARIHAKQGNAHPARTNYEKALKADADFTRAYVALALLSVESASTERNERSKAIAQARGFLAEAERRGGARDPEVAVELGQVYMKLGERDRALEILNTALRLNASNLDARMGLADYYLGAGDSKKAAELLKPFEDSDVDDTELRILLARVFRAEGHYERAVDQFEKLTEKDPKNAEFLYERGLTYFLWKNYPTAKQNFLQAYAKDPKLIKAYFYSGRVDFAEKRFPQAMKVFRSVLDESPQVGQFRFYLAFALEKNGNLPQALEEYKLVDRYDP